MKIHKEGRNIIMGSLIATTVVSGASLYLLPGWLFQTLFIVSFLLFLFVLAFFREPDRRKAAARDVSMIYAPADGKVVVCEEVVEREFFDGEPRIQVSVFMSLTNVHVNWFPVGGKILYFRHHHGDYTVAWHPKSSEENERTTTVVDAGRHRILFRQIAGYVARRIIFYGREGDVVKQCDQCGFIKFGSRIDLLLPVDSEILVKIGDKVRGTRTPIARLK
ncbi:MAG: phosphatidylserine decarboxylase family protein [Rikenellaceae bacterium]|jgi:phosphatidylserine decarboxylase|nr:phosphatidylserine decarboxylase family protein [Rikenellaceae bacterium]